MAEKSNIPKPGFLCIVTTHHDQKTLSEVPIKCKKMYRKVKKFTKDIFFLDGQHECTLKKTVSLISSPILGVPKMARVM